MYSVPLNDLEVSIHSKALLGAIWQNYLDLGYGPSKVNHLSLIESSDCGCAAQSTHPGNYEFAYENNRILPYIQNSDDIKSLWNHEYYHRNFQIGCTDQDQSKSGRSTHVEAFYYEVSQPVWGNTSNAFKRDEETIIFLMMIWSIVSHCLSNNWGEPSS